MSIKFNGSNFNPYLKQSVSFKNNPVESGQTNTPKDNKGDTFTPTTKPQTPEMIKAINSIYQPAGGIGSPIEIPKEILPRTTGIGPMPPKVDDKEKPFRLAGDLVRPREGDILKETFLPALSGFPVMIPPEDKKTETKPELPKATGNEPEVSTIKKE